MALDLWSETLQRGDGEGGGASASHCLHANVLNVHCAARRPAVSTVVSVCVVVQGASIVLPQGTCVCVYYCST
jgi:hypothetical protein